MCNRIKYIMEQLFPEIAGGTVKTWFWQVTQIYQRAYIYPAVITIVTWVLPCSLHKIQLGTIQHYFGINKHTLTHTSKYLQKKQRCIGLNMLSQVLLLKSIPFLTVMIFNEWTYMARKVHELRSKTWFLLNVKYFSSFQ